MLGLGEEERKHFSDAYLNFRVPASEEKASLMAGVLCAGLKGEKNEFLIHSAASMVNLLNSFVEEIVTSSESVYLSEDGLTLFFASGDEFETVDLSDVRSVLWLLPPVEKGLLTLADVADAGFSSEVLLTLHVVGLTFDSRDCGVLVHALGRFGELVDSVKVEYRQVS